MGTTLWTLYRFVLPISKLIAPTKLSADYFVETLVRLVVVLIYAFRTYSLSPRTPLEYKSQINWEVQRTMSIKTDFIALDFKDDFSVMN